MNDYTDKYLDHLMKIKGVSKEYGCIVRGRLKRLIDFLKSVHVDHITEVTRDHLLEFQDWIMRRNLSILTKRDELLAIVLFFRFLHDYEYIDQNPALVLDPPKKTLHLPRTILGEHEVAYLLRLPDSKDLIGIRDFCIMNLLYSSMMRTKELFNLRLDDVDLRLKQILVRRTKNKRDRVVAIAGYTAFFVQKYINHVRPWLLKSHESDHLLISATGSDLGRGSFATHFKRRYAPQIKEKFKKDVTPYVFRHSSATHWLDRGAQNKKDLLPFIQKQLGHESLESTAIYTHVAIEPLRAMFKTHHPRERTFKKPPKNFSPEVIILKPKN